MIPKIINQMALNGGKTKENNHISITQNLSLPHLA
jgi:hypothetical protein